MEQKKKMLLFMVCSILLGYLPWYNFSAVVNFMAADIKLSSSDIGKIIAAFQVGYVVVVVFTGWLADKIGPKKIITGATFLAGVFSTLFAYAPESLGSILILRVLTGAAAGAIYAPGMSLLAQWFPPNERGKAFGSYTAALVAAYAGAYFVASPIAAAYGWRLGVLVTSLPAFLGFILCLFFVKENPSYQSEVLADDTNNTRGKLWLIAPILVTIAYMGHMWELYAFWGWIGPYLGSSLFASGMGSQVASSWGGTISAMLILMGVPSCLLIGIAADKFGHVKTVVICSILSLSTSLLFGFLHGKAIWMVIFPGLWIGFWAVADSGLFKAILTNVVPARARSTALGFQSAFGFGASAIAPLVFGNLLQLNNGTVPTIEATVWWPSFLILGLGALVAPIFILTFHKWREKSTAKKIEIIDLTSEIH